MSVLRDYIRTLLEDYGRSTTMSRKQWRELVRKANEEKEAEHRAAYKKKLKARLQAKKMVEQVGLRPIDVLRDAELPLGGPDDPRRQERKAGHKKTLDWHGQIPLSDYDHLPIQGDVKHAEYPGSEKERAIEQMILGGDMGEEEIVIEIDFDGSLSLSEGNHRTHTMRRLRDEGKLDDTLVPVRIIYYGNKDIELDVWYPKSLT